MIISARSHVLRDPPTRVDTSVTDRRSTYRISRRCGLASAAIGVLLSLVVVPGTATAATPVEHARSATSNLPSVTKIETSAPVLSNKDVLSISVSVTASGPFRGTAELWEGANKIGENPIYSPSGNTGENPLYQGFATFREAGSGMATGRRQYRVRFISQTEGIGSSTSAHQNVTFYFWDKAPGTPFYTEVLWMAEAGITTGVAGGGFDPLGTVDRQAMAAFLFRKEYPHAEKPLCTEKPFVDVAVTAPFCGEIAWMASERISTGYEGNKFRPADKVSRQAIAAFLYRLRFPDAGAPRCDSSEFADVPTSSTFCGEIAWMDRVGITNGYTSGQTRTFRPNESVSRQAMAAFLYRVESD
ncbi:S-layer homology domain-containing protein [Nakamurella silvestris]|nr:S-layer homology domain-containing protein [Nakamurella silvestris]